MAETALIAYIISMLPAIVAGLSAIATMITIFVRIRELSETSNKETKQIKTDISAVLSENAELKKEMRKLMRKVYKVDEDGKK